MKNAPIQEGMSVNPSMYLYIKLKKGQRDVDQTFFSDIQIIVHRFC